MQNSVVKGLDATSRFWSPKSEAPGYLKIGWMLRPLRGLDGVTGEAEPFLEGRRALEHQHAVSVAIEAVALQDCMLVAAECEVTARPSAHQHK